MLCWGNPVLHRALTTVFAVPHMLTVSPLYENRDRSGSWLQAQPPAFAFVMSAWIQGRSPLPFCCITFPILRKHCSQYREVESQQSRHIELDEICEKHITTMHTNYYYTLLLIDTVKKTKARFADMCSNGWRRWVFVSSTTVPVVTFLRWWQGPSDLA